MIVRAACGSAGAGEIALGDRETCALIFTLISSESCAALGESLRVDGIVSYVGSEGVKALAQEY